jgi:TonB family protein
MYFDFQDGHPDLERVPSALSAREGVLVSIIVHLLAIILVLVAPQLPFFKARAAAAKAAAEAQRLAMLQRQRENQRFVFVQPRVDLTPLRPPPPQAPLSDRDRSALTRERARNPTNNQPFNRGNSPEFVERSPAPTPPRVARAPGPTQPETPQATPSPSQSAANDSDPNALRLPELVNRPPAPRAGESGGRPATGPIGEAIRNLSKYTEQNAFDNPGGGNGAFGPSIQFDTKGVEFGPWIRRFIAQIKRNWFVPQAAMSLRGHVVITFNVHKSGALTDLTVIGPSSVDSFNNAAFNALAASNPTEPLPPEYPSEHAFFTVTFYYNEGPPQTP